MLKKFAVILIFIGLLFSSAYAQKLQFGLSIGYSKARISPRPRYNEEVLYSLCAGLVVNYNFNKKLAVHSGLLYSKKGVDGTFSSWGYLTVMVPIHMKVEYLELPLVLKYNPIRNLYLGVGPYLALKIGGELTLYEEANDLLKKWDAGYVLVAGLEFDLFPKKHFIEVRFGIGTTKVVTTSHNMALVFMYGIYF
jgi:hypothetical protein